MTGRVQGALAAVSEWLRRSPIVFRNRVRRGGVRIGVRLTACFMLIVLSMMAADLVAAWQFRRITAQARRLSQADQTSLAVVRVHLDVDAFRDKLATLASTHDIRQFATEAGSLRRTFVEDVAQSQQLLGVTADPGQDPAIASALETLRTTLPSQLDTTVELALADDWSAVSLRVRDQAQTLIDLSSLLVEKVDREVSQERAQAILSGDRARRQLVLVLSVAALLTLLVAVALGWYATRSITGPLSQLEAGARALARGDFHHEIAIQGEDELGQFGRVFNQTARRLTDLYETLRNNEARLRLTIDTIPAYVWSALPDGSVDFINQRWLDFSGLSLEQGLGSGWEQAVHPEDRNHFLEAWRAAIASGKAIEAEARVRRADGQYRWLLIRNVPLHGETGTIVKWYGTSTDVHDRKQAEQALRRSEAYLADAQRLTHTGAWAGDRTTAPLYWSEEVFRIFGFDPQHGLPTRDEPLQRIHPEDLDKFQQAFTRVIHQKVDGDVEYRILLPDGTVKYVYGIAHPVLNPDGELVELVGVVADVTERKRAEKERERLRQLEADLAHINRVSMMGELAASIAHEVNQPLAGIVSNGGACLRWLAGDPPDVAEVREAVRDIVRDGKRAGEVIARIRALTRRAAPPREKVGVNETIREVLALVGDKAKRGGVIIRTQFADDVLPVLGDRVQLQQVVLNLIMNGIEAMSSVVERPRQLVISSEKADSGEVQVTVQDTGIGLDPNTKARIFDPFYTTKSGGMGMGLSISRSILQSHGGRLWATANDGPGASFHFTIPKYDEEETNAGAAAV